MQYLHSKLIDPSTYETEGLCDGIPLRAHLSRELEDIGTIRAQQDWNKYVGPINQYEGGLGPQYSFMTVSVPECLPDRLEIISYANEFAFLHDDVMDVASKAQSDKENDRMLNDFKSAGQDANIDFSSFADGKRKMQAKLMLDMVQIDEACAKTTIKVWAKFVEQASGRQHGKDFSTLDEYMEYRVLDVGQMFWYGMMTFGMGLRIPEAEEELCKTLCRPAWEAAGLTNDLFSFEKEYEAAKANGLHSVVNAIWILMKEYSVSEREAKEMCRTKIKTAVARYVAIVAETKLRTDISTDLKSYIECLQYSLSGNVVWSLSCPRYHKGAEYNERQLEWMINGVPNGVESVSSNVPSSGPITPPCESEQATIPVINEDTSCPISMIYQEASELVGTVKPAVIEDHDGSNTLDASTRLFLQKESIPLDNCVLQAPYDYVSSLPSKGVRSQAIDALNMWIRAPRFSVETIKEIVHSLHSASLMLDDFQDSSPLRRGKPSTHTIFGSAQTVNSAGFHIIAALSKSQNLPQSEAIAIVLDELQALYRGQSFDLYWTTNMLCPSIAEYIAMIDDKTGGLFRLLIKLLQISSTTETVIDLLPFGHLLGRYFQIRDDYMNLYSADYSKQKGACEDLDEGKYSLPLIHALTTKPEDMVLRSLLVQRHINGSMSIEHKMLMLDKLQRTGSLDYTKKVLSALHKAVSQEIEALELQTGRENPQLRLLIEMLKV